MTGADVIRVVIADDHRAVRYTLKVIMEIYDDILVTGEATNGSEAVALCEQLQPDLVLMDLMMPQMDGVTATKIIRSRFPAISILVLTSGIDRDLINQAIQAGARGYLEKNVTNDTIADAIRAAVNA